MTQIKAPIIELKRFAVHDGDGIRTTVFLKGCPLKCVWCHNPEGIAHAPQLAYYESKCLHCGECVSICPSGAHYLSESGHIFSRDLCAKCGKCESVCLGTALKFYGQEMSPEELLPLLLEDRDFYETSNGGVTLSGGECLAHSEFSKTLLRLLKENRIQTAVDTCGFVSRTALDKVIPYTDVFLYDLKAFDEAVHIRCTGQSNRLILENLRYLDDCGKEIEIRIPYVPGYNDKEISAIGGFLSKIRHLTKIRVLPYHSYAGSKYAALGMENTLPATIPTDEEIKAARETLRAFGLTVME